MGVLTALSCCRVYINLRTQCTCVRFWYAVSCFTHRNLFRILGFGSLILSPHKTFLPLTPRPFLSLHPNLSQYHTSTFLRLRAQYIFNVRSNLFLLRTDFSPTHIPTFLKLTSLFPNRSPPNLSSTRNPVFLYLTSNPFSNSQPSSAWHSSLLVPV
jgi:hypothetical protein